VVCPKSARRRAAEGLEGGTKGDCRRIETGAEPASEFPIGEPDRPTDGDSACFRRKTCTRAVPGLGGWGKVATGGAPRTILRRASQ
jgi:hypothetical protein